MFSDGVWIETDSLCPKTNIFSIFNDMAKGEYLPEHQHLVETYILKRFQNINADSFEGVIIYDGVCGIGKTEEIKEHIKKLISTNPKNRVIYVGQYIEELHRIAGTTIDPNKSISKAPKKDFRKKIVYDSLEKAKLNFIHPEYRPRKITHFKQLISANENIVITHKLFEQLDIECIKLLTDKNYHVIIDEEPIVLDLVTDRYSIVFKRSKVKQTISGIEIDNLFKQGILGFDSAGKNVIWKGVDLPRYQDLKEDIENNNIIIYNYQENNIKNMLLIWRQNPEIFKVFKSVHVLTYMFKHSFLNAYLDINKIPYFLRNLTEEEALDDSRLRPYHKLIHLDPLTLSKKDFSKEFGSEYLFSSKWFETYKKVYESGQANPLRTKLETYFQKHLPFTSNLSKPEDRLWTTIKKARKWLVGKGFKGDKSFLVYNKKATNDYINTNHLAFIYNIYHPQSKLLNYIASEGIETSQMVDKYALSIMIQWIFRSGLRKGENIFLLLPSERMRGLLDQWIKEMEALYENCRYIRNNINDPKLKKYIVPLDITTWDDFFRVQQPGLQHYKYWNTLMLRFPTLKVRLVKKKTTKQNINKKTLVKKNVKKRK